MFIFKKKFLIINFIYYIHIYKVLIDPYPYSKIIKFPFQQFLKLKNINYLDDFIYYFIKKLFFYLPN